MRRRRNHAITCHVKKLQSELLNYLCEIFPLSVTAFLQVSGIANMRHRWRQRDANANNESKSEMRKILTSMNNYISMIERFIFFLFSASAMGHADAWMIMVVNGAVINRRIVTFVSRWMDVNLMKLNCSCASLFSSTPLLVKTRRMVKRLISLLMRLNESCRAAVWVNLHRPPSCCPR